MRSSGARPDRPAPPRPPKRAAGAPAKPAPPRPPAPADAPASSASASSTATQAEPAVRPAAPTTSGRLPRPAKSELVLYRTDGLSCTRETVQPGGTLKLAYPSTQQQLLVWKTPPRSVLVLKKLGDELRPEFTAVVRHLGAVEGLLVLVEPSELEPTRAALGPASAAFLDTFDTSEAAALHECVDFVVCMGGDGLVLHASSLFRRAIPPVVSFNCGSLGFLTNHAFAEHAAALGAVIRGRDTLESCAVTQAGTPAAGVHVTLRMRLECRVLRDGQPLGDPIEVLNEVVVDRGASPYLTKIECWERDRLVTKVQADGVMLATTTGSTAYSVAAGGSMVHPNVPAILFTPICPHSLSFRPVVLPDYAELELRIAGDMRCSAWVCFDGKKRRELQRGDSVAVRMSPNPVPTIARADSTNDWFDTLNRCFGWNERMEQKPYDGRVESWEDLGTG